MIFGQPPNAGDQFTLDDRTIVCRGNKPHTTRDGRDIVLIEWTSDCAHCHRSYDFASTFDVSRASKRCRPCIDAQPKWSAKWLTPEEKKQKAVDRRNRNAKISASLIAHHDRRLGRNELKVMDD